MKSFINDKDGLSAKDYLLILSTTVFFLFVVIGLVLVLSGKNIDSAYLSLLDAVAPIVMTVVGGTFGVQAVTEFRRKDSDYVPTDQQTNNGGDFSGRV